VGGGKVRAIDSGTVSAGLALLALGVQERLERGTTDEEVDAYVERFRRESRIVFTVDTLDYLARGGRIGKAAAMAGTLLNIKPILTIEDGEVIPVKRVRGAHKAFLEFVETFEQGSVDRPSLRVGIADAEAPDRRDAIRELVGRTRPEARIEVETTLGAVVGTHAGPGTVGFFWFDEA
jgi:DegV family protein with EDD domain